ncbi:MAG: twin-arginine translocase TatA/TatE family subunit [Sulfurimonas sp.]|nr:twin-arginine translocase TatA/TatE family subunit [Sulfurimonas sp.]
MGMPGGTELLIILAIVVLLFGAKKIPDLAKGLGKGIKNFKSEMKEVNADEVETASAQAPKKVEGSEETASTEAPETTKKA